MEEKQITTGDLRRGPRRESPPARPVMMCASSHSVYMLDNRGWLFGCGSNTDGQLGLGDNRDRMIFAKIMDLRLGSRVKICAGGCSFYLIDDKGCVFACGSNCSGNLGLGDNVNRNVLTKLDFPRQRAASRICAGTASFYLLDASGDLYACGGNKYGQLGLGGYMYKNALTKLNFPRLGKDSQICASYSSFYVFDGKHSIFACGYNHFGSLGFGECEQTNILTKLNFNATRRAKISAGWGFNVIQKNQIYACGEDTHGGLVSSGSTKLAKLQLKDEIKSAKLICGSQSSHLISSGELYACGRNNFGQLGTGDELSRMVLTKIALPQGIRVIAICAIDNSSFAISRGGRLYVSGFVWELVGAETNKVNLYVEVD